jgi:hypothetical protein
MPPKTDTLTMLNRVSPFLPFDLARSQFDTEATPKSDDFRVYLGGGCGTRGARNRNRV